MASPEHVGQQFRQWSGLHWDGRDDYEAEPHVTSEPDVMDGFGGGTGTAFG